MNEKITLDAIVAAAGRIAGAVHHTPCPYSLTLSRLCGCEIYCKLDHLQMTGSFKERGARNRLMQLSSVQRETGVIAASAGNHAQALAYHGKQLDIPVTVVMPRWAPLVKVANCRSFGADVILEGETFAEARRRADALASEQGLTYINGFDDPAIIAGQGTVGLEILEDVPDVDAVILPVGGGGLLAGAAVAIKSIRPDVRIIAAEAQNAPTLYESLRAGHVVRTPTLPTLADGLAIAEMGSLCFELIRNRLDDLRLVDEAHIAQAVLRLLELEKMVIEGAGAVPLAAAMQPSLHLAGKKVVLCLSGGNIDVTVISRVIERGLAADGRLTHFTSYVSDRPGSLASLLGIIADTGASVKEVFHDRNFAPPDVGSVAIRCVVETRDFEHIQELHEALGRAHIQFDAASPPSKSARQ